MIIGVRIGDLVAERADQVRGPCPDKEGSFNIGQRTSGNTTERRDADENGFFVCQ